MENKPTICDCCRGLCTHFPTNTLERRFIDSVPHEYTDTAKLIVEGWSNRYMKDKHQIKPMESNKVRRAWVNFLDRT